MQTMVPQKFFASKFLVKWTVHRFFFFLDPCGRPCDRFYDVIGTIAPLPLMVDHFGPIRDTIKSTVAVLGVEEMKNGNRIHALESVPWAY